MTERGRRDREPTDESAAGLRRASAHDWLDDVRAARRAERAPDDVRERLLERARELGQSVEGHPPSVPFGVEPRLSLGLLDERPLNDRLLAGRLLPEKLLPERTRFERPLGESGPLEAWTHPLLARVAGAGLMIGLVVLVIADVRRPTGSALPAPMAHVPPSAGSSPSVVSERAPAAEARAADDSPSETRGFLATGPAALAFAQPADAPVLEPAVLGALREQDGVRPELSGLARQLAARARLVSASRPAGLRVEDARPAVAPPAVPRSRDAAPPWPSPHAALAAIRSVTMPYFEGAPSYPEGTRVLARGNVRSDSRSDNNPESGSPESGRNFITNGDFSRGDLMWSVRSWQGFGHTSVAAYYSVKAGALCTTLERDQQVLGGWPWDDRRLSPSSFDLERGKRYRLSLRAWSSGPELVQLVVKVGHQKPPYTPALVAKVPITAEPGLFDIDFVAERHDAAGFAFVAASPGDRPLSDFCIDDVSVRPIDADP